MATEKQRRDEAKRRLAEKYRDMGYGQDALMVEHGTHARTVDLIADILRDTDWEPPADPREAALQDAQRAFNMTGETCNANNIRNDVVAVFNIGEAFGREHP